MTTDLSSQVVTITGASSGIGKATARACAKAGASLALAARRIDRVEQLAEQILGEMAKRFEGVTPLAAEDIANAALYAICQQPNVSVGELLIRPAGQR